jgi:hypothetical protein
MKKFELKQIIKEEIRSVLSEESWFEKIKNYFFGLKPGNLIIRPDATAGGGSNLYILTEPITEGNWVKVMHIGGIHRNYKNKIYASLIFNTKNTGIVGIRKNTDDYLSYRKLNNKEKKLVKDAISSGKFQRYIDIITNKTGLNIRI